MKKAKRIARLRAFSVHFEQVEGFLNALGKPQTEEQQVRMMMMMMDDG